MKFFLRAFALVVVTTFAQGAFAADEAQEIQGDEMKADPANKPGGGTSDAASPAGEDAAVQGDEMKAAPANKPAGGTSDAASPAAEDSAIQGNEGK
jgi:hypothetical protein